MRNRPFVAHAFTDRRSQCLPVKMSKKKKITRRGGRRVFFACSNNLTASLGQMLGFAETSRNTPVQAANRIPDCPISCAFVIFRGHDADHASAIGMTANIRFAASIRLKHRFRKLGA